MPELHPGMDTMYNAAWIESMERLNEAEDDLRAAVLDGLMPFAKRIPNTLDSLRGGERQAEMLTAIAVDLAIRLGIEDEEAGQLVGEIASVAILGDRVRALDAERRIVMGSAITSGGAVA